MTPSYSYSSDWANIVAAFDKGVARTFRFEENGEYCRFNYVLRDIANDIPNIAKNTYFDIVTPFDYGAFEYSDERILDKAMICFEQTCQEDGVVSGFFRFNPVIAQNYGILGKHLQLNKVQEHVFIDLRGDFEQHFSKRKVRNIRKAQKLKLQFCNSQQIDDFYEVYVATMERIGAAQYYYFGREILSEVMPYCRVFTLRHHNEIASSILVIEDVDDVYYFLGGTDQKYLTSGCNSLLFAEVCRYYKGVKNIFYLGGGKNGLHTFKQEFSPQRLPFYVGKKVFSKNVYDELVACSQNYDNDFFPQYREKVI